MVRFARETMDEQNDSRFFWIVVLAILLLTRLPAMASYLSIDNVNLAFSLERFDPRIHQPQPPGYPFFVFFGRIINLFFHDAERTFVAVSVIVSALSLPLAFLLAKRMFSPQAGVVAALLLLVNPVFWYSGLEGPLRPNLALFSLLAAYCCWRCWNGEKRFAIWGAIALGVGSGFRPDLMAFLFPLWIVSVWAGTKSWRAVLKGLGALAVVGLVWAGALVFAMGGIRMFMKIMLDYAVDQSKPESAVFGSSLLAWLRQINRIVIWNGLAVVTWIWAVPFYLRRSDRVPIAGAHTVFFFVWLVPGFIIQALVHIGAPGHTLFSVPALCVLGGYMLSLVPSRQVVLGAALVLNVMLFLDFFALPAGVENVESQLPSVKNALLFGTFQSSIGQIRWMDDVARTSLAEIEQFTPKDRPSIIISTDTYVAQWFMNWRIARYYIPKREIWVLYNETKNERLERVRRDVLLEMRDLRPLRIPLFREGRILWLIEPHSAIYEQIAATQHLEGGKYIFYSDITPDSPPFAVGDFEIVPALFGFIPPKTRSFRHP